MKGFGNLFTRLGELELFTWLAAVWRRRICLDEEDEWGGGGGGGVVMLFLLLFEEVWDVACLGELKNDG